MPSRVYLEEQIKLRAEMERVSARCGMWFLLWVALGVAASYYGGDAWARIGAFFCAVFAAGAASSVGIVKATTVLTEAMALIADEAD